MSKKNIIIICIAVTLIVAIVCIYYIQKAHLSGAVEENIIINANNNIEIVDNSTIETSSSEKEVVLPNATLKIEEYYENCGHKIEEEYEVPEEIVNMTQEEVKEYYYGWTLNNFSEDYLEIYKEIDGMCSEHYVVRDEDGQIVVYNKNESGQEILIKTTDILTKYLPETDQEKLKDGVEIIGKTELSSFLEDYE